MTTQITKQHTNTAQRLTSVSSRKLRSNENCLMKYALVNNMLNSLYVSFPLSYLRAASQLDSEIDVKVYLKKLIDSGYTTPEQLAIENKCLNA